MHDNWSTNMIARLFHQKTFTYVLWNDYCTMVLELLDNKHWDSSLCMWLNSGSWYLLAYMYIQFSGLQKLNELASDVDIITQSNRWHCQTKVWCERKQHIKIQYSLVIKCYLVVVLFIIVSTALVKWKSFDKRGLPMIKRLEPICTRRVKCSTKTFPAGITTCRHFISQPLLHVNR
jgi:hypothetical protein